VELALPLELEYPDTRWSVRNTPPKQIRVLLQGSGWRLFRLYLERPRIRLEVQPGRMRLDQLAGWDPPLPSGVVPLRFRPQELELVLEEALTRRLPLEVDVQVDLAPPLGLLEPPRLEPESVTVTGPASLVRDLRAWRLPPVRLSEVSRSLEHSLQTADPAQPQLRVQPERVTLHVRVAEYTEATRRIPVQLRNRPPEAPLYRLIPDHVQVTYRVPLEEFEIADTTRALVAYVEYGDLVRNSSGVLVPALELPPFLHLRIVRIDRPGIRFLRLIVDSTATTRDREP